MCIRDSYSMNQGYKGWYYGSDNGNSFRASVWKPELNAWQGDETYSLIWDNGFHPGSLSKAVRRWVAPSDGQILISGRVIDQNSTCGDGIILSITKDKSLLYSVSDVYKRQVPYPTERKIILGNNNKPSPDVV